MDQGKSFVVESTLSGLTFKAVMEQARHRAFDITIVFVFLKSEEACAARIQERVRKGGHPVSEEDIRRGSFSRVDLCNGHITSV